MTRRNRRPARRRQRRGQNPGYRTTPLGVAAIRLGGIRLVHEMALGDDHTARDAAAALKRLSKAAGPSLFAGNTAIVDFAALMLYEERYPDMFGMTFEEMRVEHNQLADRLNDFDTKGAA